VNMRRLDIIYLIIERTRLSKSKRSASAYGLGAGLAARVFFVAEMPKPNTSYPFVRFVLARSVDHNGVMPCPCLRQQMPERFVVSA
jgi:hypothetical protein